MLNASNVYFKGLAFDRFFYGYLFLVALWGIALFPGNPSTDVNVAIGLAQNGIIDSHGTVSFGIALYILTLGGKTIVLFGLFQFILFNFSLLFLLYTILGSRWAFRIMFYLALIPLLMPISWTHTHDIWATSGFFIGLALCINPNLSQTRKPHSKHSRILLLVLSGLLVSMHFNIIFTATVLVMLVISSKVRFTAKVFPSQIVSLGGLLVMLASSFFFTIAFALLIGTGAQENTAKYESFSRAILLADLACISYLGDDNVKYLGNIRSSPRDTLHACDLIFEGEYTSKYVKPYAELSTPDLASKWINTVFNEPKHFIISHYNRSWPFHAISVLPPYQTWVLSETLLPNPPKAIQFNATFLSAYDGDTLSRFDAKTNIYPSREGNLLFKIVQKPVGLWNQLLLLTGNAGFILLILLIFLYFTRAAVSLNMNLIFLRVVGIIYLANLISLSIVSPAPEIRYSYPSLLLVYSLLFVLLHSFSIDFVQKKGSRSRPL